MRPEDVGTKLTKAVVRAQATDHRLGRLLGSQVTHTNCHLLEKLLVVHQLVVLSSFA